MAPRKSKQSRRKSQRNRQSRRQHNRQTRRQAQRQQRGGSGCAAFGNNYASMQQGGEAPLNYVMGQGQKGGMAPFNYENALAIGDAATRMQAQASGLDSYIATSQALADKFGTPMFYKGLNQAGGRRKKHGHSRRCTHRQQKQRGGRRGYPYRQQKQRGGDWEELQKYDAAYTSGFSDAVTGVNPQFHTEGSVNSLYAANRGPQF